MHSCGVSWNSSTKNQPPRFLEDKRLHQNPAGNKGTGDLKERNPSKKERRNRHFDLEKEVPPNSSRRFQTLTLDIYTLIKSNAGIVSLSILMKRARRTQVRRVLTIARRAAEPKREVFVGSGT